MRLRFASTNPERPLYAIERVKDHLEVTLTTDSIAQHLGWDESDVDAIFAPSIRKRFAVNYIGDPLKSIDRVRKHLETTLTDASIAEYLGVDEEFVKSIFLQHIRKHFAVGDITDPLQACHDWLHGKITVGPKEDRSRDRKLAQLYLDNLASS